MTFLNKLALVIATVFCTQKIISASDIVVLFDGTWNNSIDGIELEQSPKVKLFESQLPILTSDKRQLTRDEQEPHKLHEESTNIARLFNLLVSDEDQPVAYIRGLGTGDRIDSFTGGAFGVGANERIEAANEFLEMVYKPGDEICLFGFSRGAAIARKFAIQLSGGQSEVPNYKIRFLGLFDTVAAFGIPKTEFSQSEGVRKKFFSFFSSLEIPDSVERCVHLVALDEDRLVFVPTLISQVPVNSANRKEIWFGGNHGDVGGGWNDNYEDGSVFRRRQVTLRFMLEQDHGLRLIRDWQEHPDVRVDRSEHPNYGRKHTKEDLSFISAFGGEQKRIPVDGEPGFAVPYDPRRYPEVIHDSARQ